VPLLRHLRIEAPDEEPVLVDAEPSGPKVRSPGRQRDGPAP
jgi:hypothetical protein